MFFFGGKQKKGIFLPTYLHDDDDDYYYYYHYYHYYCYHDHHEHGHRHRHHLFFAAIVNDN